MMRHCEFFAGLWCRYALVLALLVPSVIIGAHSGRLAQPHPAHQINELQAGFEVGLVQDSRPAPEKLPSLDYLPKAVATIVSDVRTATILSQAVAGPPPLLLRLVYTHTFTTYL